MSKYVTVDVFECKRGHRLTRPDGASTVVDSIPCPTCGTKRPAEMRFIGKKRVSSRHASAPVQQQSVSVSSGVRRQRSSTNDVPRDPRLPKDLIDA